MCGGVATTPPTMVQVVWIDVMEVGGAAPGG